MFADKALRCDCGYEVKARDEAARVEAVRRHALKAHGIELSVALALDVVRRADVMPTSKHKPTQMGEETR